ncbi:MAG: tetratricopeptide repeat protein [Acidimicrobiales bacterium]
MSDVVDLYATLPDEAWWVPAPPQRPVGPTAAAPIEPVSPAVPDLKPNSQRGVESHRALEALGALVADTHLRREHWELAQRAHRRHDNRSCLEDCLAVLALDPNHRQARELGAKAARDLRQWSEAAALLNDLLQGDEPAGQLDWDRIVAATVTGDEAGVNASVARLGLDPCTWQHPEALILVMLDGRAQVARRMGPAAAEVLSIAAGDRPQHVGDVVAFDPTPLYTTPTLIEDSSGFAAVAAAWPPPAPGTAAAPLPPPPVGPQAPVRPQLPAPTGSGGADMPGWPTFRTLAILASGARQSWIVKGIDPGFEAWDDTVAELRERGWILRRVPAVDSDHDDRLGVVALSAALDPSEVRAALQEVTSRWPVTPGWHHQL